MFLILASAAQNAIATDLTDTLLSGNLHLYSSATTSTAALNHNVAAGSVKEILEVRVHLSASVSSGTLATKIDAATGTYWDVVLDSGDLANKTDYVFRPTRPIVLKATDALNVSFANPGAKTWGVEVIWRKP